MMSRDSGETLAEALDKYMSRESRSVSWLYRATGIPKPTLRNWREGRIKRPRDWRDVARIARALRLNAAGANRLLQ
ncbi:MAG: hypothetical protein GY803_20410, partial [Chloroflexi bacterium]|nr:hypothetical protein [Chloroflexota bacterium]